MPLPWLRAPVVTVLLVAVFATACTSDDDSDAETPSASTPTSTGPTVTVTRPDAPLTVSVEQLGGGFTVKQRLAIRDAASKPIASWIGQGFLDVSYPQSNFSGGFDSWTFRAAVLGVRDRDITTNAALGESLAALVADQQRVKLYVFSDNGHTGGATARVWLRFTGQKLDGTLVHFRVSGDLYLTRRGVKWQIFGYDLQRSTEPR